MSPSLSVHAMAAVAVLALTWPALALAHAEPGGAGGLLSGLLHPISGLDQVLAMVAVGLWGAQLGSPAMWLLPVAFPLVMAFGGLLGLVGIALPGVELGIALRGAGALVAVGGAAFIWQALGGGADLPLPPRPLALVAAALGLLLGWGNGAQGGGLALAGTLGALVVVAALLAGQVASLRALWARTAVRVAGSWIAAIGLLQLGRSLRSV